ncbi:O-antigen ligase family protein [Wenzhouxiangella sp. XN79A]|uniref:O-antigen ligase family protein n=1 Tax=Wenzhouxiangella sp. XN79A TaxID=2724193 RepID=UPI00197FC2F7|nr:O-antigen ligase family protein [Wenzhouxiangella sp. XN79A]
MPPTAILATLVLVLPLMMGNRTPDTLTLSGLVLVLGALVAAMAAWLGKGRALPGPPKSWWIFGGVLTGWVVLQVLPVEFLARSFGPYPDALWQSDAPPGQWSPNPAWTLRAWATFVALATLAWLFGRLDHRRRNLVWLVVAVGAVLQALYGLAAHAAGSDTVLGIWPRNNPDYVHGTFSNRNLFAAYLALTWPLVIAIWWKPDVPGLKRLPFELRVAGSVIAGAIIGAALLASASRLGSAAGLAGLLVGLVLWTRYRRKLARVAVWPMYATAFAALIAATWYGLTPLAERLAVTSIEEGRFEVYSRMIGEVPAGWWLWGVGLGGFEAVFKQVQPADMRGWYDYAHNDLLQWLLEMGLVGAGLLLAAAVALVKHARLTRETLPLYSGLAALGLVGLGDFSWHIPATQVVLALYLGTLLTPAHKRKPTP